MSDHEDWPEPMLPKMVRVEWMRGERVQTSVGFLVADGGSHLVLSDQYDGKHPLNGRLRTIHHSDIRMREEIGRFEFRVASDESRDELPTEFRAP